MPHPSFLCHRSTYGSGGVAVAFSCSFRSLPAIPLPVGQGPGLAGSAGSGSRVPSRRALGAASRGGRTAFPTLSVLPFPSRKKGLKTSSQKKRKVIAYKLPSAARPPAAGAGCGTGRGPPQFLPAGSCGNRPAARTHLRTSAPWLLPRQGRAHGAVPVSSSGAGEVLRNPKPSNTAPFLSFQTRTKAKQAAWN